MKEIITTSCYGEKIQLVWRPEVEEIQQYIDDGFVPIEMAEGTRSFVDFRVLDHHNEYSDLPSACITALKYYGDIAGGDPVKIMVNHTDSDSVMTGLTLLGFLPLNVLEELNQEIGILDTEPLIADIEDMKYFELISLWKLAMGSVKQSGWSWLYGLQLWLDIYFHKDKFSRLLEELKKYEDERREIAASEYAAAKISPSGRVVAISNSKVKGYDVQFVRQKEFSPLSLEGWRHWCIVSYVEKSGVFMLSCPCRNVAEIAFGQGGLKNVMPLLPKIDGREWGGRESVGGSPRGVRAPLELLDTVVDVIEKSFVL